MVEIVLLKLLQYTEIEYYLISTITQVFCSICFVFISISFIICMNAATFYSDFLQVNKCVSCYLYEVSIFETWFVFNEQMASCFFVSTCHLFVVIFSLEHFFSSFFQLSFFFFFTLSGLLSSFCSNYVHEILAVCCCKCSCYP